MTVSHEFRDDDDATVCYARGEVIVYVDHALGTSALLPESMLEQLNRVSGEPHGRR